jgi:hypothetical protein
MRKSSVDVFRRYLSAQALAAIERPMIPKPDSTGPMNEAADRTQSSSAAATAYDAMLRRLARRRETTGQSKDRFKQREISRLPDCLSE